ncbi:efflux RND transporter periplasmic adaptor subunit [Mannheimia sp. AT1]|uniref:Efflux RND transporter periplasmic adaptor subunit n=1 Tax=Mannheimia cairinae TaxID=3025936 RepID=A0ABT5MNL3_9PAST|nr:efflux RND transporter periplasmic adaptor subunit [Mannheimia cairinae]MDD0823592.1 efflux RND transporter periplasmic adaptor subunit [Mannheimia cairinae]MDD0825476.1 efflux RND transporter periplasmic adaptor subunit [Mannheimia cairinae]
MKLKKLATLTIIIAISVGGYIYYNQKNTTTQIHYITEPVTRAAIDKSVLATGSVRANKRTEVGAQVSGKIQKLYVELGQTVKQGDLIADIDSSNQSNSLSTAEAQLSSYQAQLKSAQVALEVAQSNYNRLNRLYKANSTSLNELESAKNTLASAKASVDNIKAQIKSAEISVNDARTNLTYTQIVSPMDGVIVSVPVSVGQTVNSNQVSPTIVQVADLSKMLIKLEISEGDIAQVKVGQNVSFSTLAEPERTYNAIIDSVDPALTTLTDNSYTEKSGNTEAVYYYANVSIDNTDNSLRIGMTTQAQITIDKRENVLVVPTTVIKKRGKENYVLVLENGKSVEKPIQLGLADSINTEVLSGLNEGDNIIVTQRAAGEQISITRGPRMF